MNAKMNSRGQIVVTSETLIITYNIRRWTKHGKDRLYLIPEDYHSPKLTYDLQASEFTNGAKMGSPLERALAPIIQANF